MLYGTNRIQKQLLDEVKQCEKEKGIKVIYGALVGSISKGIQCVDSDYDTRFLYINKDFPQNILCGEYLPEENVIYRRYLEDTCFEKIPFWEFSSFLQYLAMPSIEGKFSTGLYNVVGWTFMSPYSWDPYGIGNKILPIIQKSFCKDYFLDYHKQILGKNKCHGKKVNAKIYLNELYSALAIDWVNRYNEFPPVCIDTLLYNVEKDIIDKTRELVSKLREKTQKKVRNANEIDLLHGLSDDVVVDRVTTLDCYMEKMLNDVMWQELKRLEPYEILEIQKDLNYIYSIIQKSICEQDKKFDFE